MDWLAGSRLHLIDIVVTCGLTYVPIYALGFAEAPLFAYLVFVSVRAVFIHANVRFELRWLHWLPATPRFHHWLAGGVRDPRGIARPGRMAGAIAVRVPAALTCRQRAPAMAARSTCRRSSIRSATARRRLLAFVQ